MLSIVLCRITPWSTSIGKGISSFWNWQRTSQKSSEWAWQKSRRFKNIATDLRRQSCPNNVWKPLLKFRLTKVSKSPATPWAESETIRISESITRTTSKGGSNRLRIALAPQWNSMRKRSFWTWCAIMRFIGSCFQGRKGETCGESYGQCKRSFPSFRLTALFVFTFVYLCRKSRLYKRSQKAWTHQ